jgi:hypothetical protein
VETVRLMLRTVALGAGSRGKPEHSAGTVRAEVAWQAGSQSRCQSTSRHQIAHLVTGWTRYLT